ncbi:aldo/keto reductase [Streptomyces sp. NBC_01594]
MGGAPLLDHRAGRRVGIDDDPLGAAQFGNLFTETTDDESHRAVRAAAEEGIRYFDTAPHYGLGLSERDQSALDDLLPVASARGVGVVAAAAVYNSGLLSSTAVDGSANYDYGAAPRAVVERAARIAAVCERHGVELPVAAI